MNPSPRDTCPRCGGRLGEIVLGPVHVDRCEGCGGLWFDAGELERVRRQRLGAAARPGAVVPTDRGLAADCPGCGRRGLDVVKVEGFEVERCASCGGLFLDGGEIEAMLKVWGERARAGEADTGTARGLRPMDVGSGPLDVGSGRGSRGRTSSYGVVDLLSDILLFVDL